MSESVCVITARGGSKRIPRKNIRDFCGKPIMAYSIDAALESGLFDEVMVSTDDEEIAEVARHYGANVPFLRSAKTSDDYATTADVLREVLESYSRLGMVFDVLCCLYPTAPFVTSRSLREAYGLLSDNSTGVLAVAEHRNSPLRSMRKDGNFLGFAFPEFANSRSQDLPTLYFDAGQFAFYSVSSFLDGETMRFRAYVVNELEVQDIDNQADWRLAEFKYQYLRLSGGGHEA